MKRLFILLPIAVLLVSCFASPEERLVRAAYDRFAAAVRAGDSSSPLVAPAFAADASGEAFKFLKTALETNPSRRVRVLDGTNAVVQLSDPNRTLIPFVKGADGSWTVSDHVERRQFIDFVPAK